MLTFILNPAASLRGFTFRLQRLTIVVANLNRWKEIVTTHTQGD